MSVYHHYRRALCVGLLTGTLLTVSNAPVTAEQIIAEPAMPLAMTGVENGYFPTLAESALLRGPANSRSLGADLVQDGPDLSQQNATGLFPYEDSNPNFYRRNDSFFRPLDQTLGVFTPNDAATIQFSELDNTSLTLDGNLGFLTRQFAPDLAMLKAGPLYLDVLWLGSGLIWSDYNGDRNFNTAGGVNRGDGTIAYVDVAVRGFLRLTNSLFLTATADLMYLPFDNRIALRFGNGRNAGLLTRLNYSETFGDWDVLLYDEFRGRPGLNWYGDGNINGRDGAGRYFYGFQTAGPSNEFYNQDYVRFTNKLGFSASRLVLDNQWRLWLAADIMDFWQSYSFSNHRRREHAGVAMGYEGSIIPFAPRLSYDIYSYNGFDTLAHRIFLSLTGRLTENLHWGSRVGEMFFTGDRTNLSSTSNRFLWQIDLNHSISMNTNQWVAFGENVNDNDISGESITSKFVTYGIGQRFSSRFYGQAFFQYVKSESVVGSTLSRDRNSAGITLRYQPLDFTQLIASAIHDSINQSTLPGGDVDRWRYRISVAQQLGLRLTGNLFYQYEDRQATGPGAFSEHVLGVSLRKFF